ncbi:MAG: hypothetical protein CL483_14440 [Acidobacteria bacterium]|nr:hypothetical protein [Acidobacteriota bacterium]
MVDIGASRAQHQPRAGSLQMLNRREFVRDAAIGAATLTRGLHAFQADHDLVIRGGRVIDPSLHLDRVADVAVSDGLITAVGPSLPSASAEDIDASGFLVLPGLLDVHTHYARDPQGPALCLSDGVTGWVDAGSEGADQIDEMVAIARAAPQPARVLLNIGREGILPDGDTHRLELADVDVAKAAIARHRDYVIGVKARLTEGVTADDVEVLRRAQEVATSFSLPVMIHMGQSATPMSTLLALLKPGDIVTHMYAPPPNAIVNDAGHIWPAVLSARRRGIWFDVANGRVDHLLWDTFDAIMAAGFWPDTISTDGNTTSRQAASVIDLPNVMSKFLNFGMPLEAVVACVTRNASRLYPFFRDRGTLNVGAPADIAVLELREDRFEFVDNYENLRVGTQRLLPHETVISGRRAPRV